MYRYALRQSASVPRFLYPAKGYGIISLTLKLVWRKNSKNNEFRTKKFPNPEFLYGISSFCTLSENNSFLHGKISCFCIFLAENGVFNTNRSPRVADGIRNELCFRIFPLTTLGSMFQLEEKCHIQNNEQCPLQHPRRRCLPADPPGTFTHPIWHRRFSSAH